MTNHISLQKNRRGIIGINEVIIYIVAGFACLGAVDVCLDNRMGLGDQFKEGFMAMGPLSLVIIGIVSLAPVIASVLTPIVSPVYSLVGADPASFANTILAIDMGGYALAQEMAETREAALFSWVFLGTMIGPAISFTIPVSLGLIDKDDRPHFAKGIMLGLITVPIGCFVGGLTAGFNIYMMTMNLLPMIFFSCLIAIGLWKIPTLMIGGFSCFGRGVEMLSILGLAAIILETLTDWSIIPNMTPLSEGVQIIGSIAIFLAGAFPLVAFLSRVGKTFLYKLGKYLSINEASTAGLIASLAHIIPMLAILREMGPRGKVINVAFAVSGAFVLGAHLGIVAGLEQEMAFPMVIGKLAGGLSAVGLAILTTKP